MATKTTNLGLSKAELTDAVRSTLIANNENFDILDSTYQSMREQIDRLKANQIQGTASGTEIEITDSANMESILHISGNSEQDSRSGKNVVNLYNAGTYNSTLSIVDSNNLKVTVSSTPTASGAFCYFKKSDGSYLTVEEVLNKTIRLTCNFTKSRDELKVRFAIIRGAGGVNSTEFSLEYTDGAISTYTFTSTTATQPYVGIFLGIQLEGGGNLSAGDYVEYSNIIATIDNEDMSYEPYGTMPSPEFPSEIRSVKSKSDNLFDKSSQPIRTSGAVLTSVLDTGIRTTITYAGDACWIRYILGDMSQYVGKTVRVKANFVTSGTNTPAFWAGICNSDGTNIKQLSETAKVSGKELSFVIPQLVSPQTYLGITFYSTLGVVGVIDEYTDFTNIMVTIDSEIKNYQPYGYVPVEAKVEGKNLAINDYEEGYTRTHNGITYVVNEDNSISINGTSTAVSSFTFCADVSFQAGTYVMSGSVANVSFILSRNGINEHSVANGSQIFDAEEEKAGCKLVLRIASGKTINATVYPQIERGSTATPYTPCVAPKTISLPLGDIQLRSTPDGTRDTFERVDGVWNKVSNIGSVVFDGSDDENWVLQNDATCIRFNSLQISNMKNTLNCRCNKLVTVPYADRNKYDNALLVYSDKYIRISNITNVTNLTQLKTFLSSNPITVQYQLDTPTYTPITDETLIQALDTLEQLILHKGYNRITATSVNGVKAYLDLSYIKDINSVLDNINAIILTLGGGANV